MTPFLPPVSVRGGSGKSWSADRLVTANDNTVKVWEAGTGQQIAVLQGLTDVVNLAAFSSDGTRIVTAS